jgi:hypothetical protein
MSVMVSCMWILLSRIFLSFTSTDTSFSINELITRFPNLLYSQLDTISTRRRTPKMMPM